LYTSCVLGLCPSALFIEFLLIKKKYKDLHQKVDIPPKIPFFSKSSIKP
jgi:hypothetical protein